MQPNFSTKSGRGLLDILQLICFYLTILPVIIISLNTTFARHLGADKAPGDPQYLAKGARLCLQACCGGITHLEMIINGT